MNISLLRFSIVVVAGDHNPTILNPDFLRQQNIIPSGFGWDLASPPITTPPFSTVQYDSGVSISVETNKLQVVDSKVAEPTSSRIVEIVKNYVNVVNLVRYTSIGINFQSAIDVDDADEVLKSRFFSEEPWKSSNNKLQSAGLKLVYKTDSGHLVLSIESGKVKGGHGDSNLDKSVIITSANFHRDLDAVAESSVCEQVHGYLDELSVDWDRYNEIINEILPIKNDSVA